MQTSKNDSLQQENDDLKAQKDEVQKNWTSLQQKYQCPGPVPEPDLGAPYYRTGDLVTAAKTFADANFDMIEDENIQGIISNIRQDMAGNIYQSLVQQGLQLWNGSDKTQAMDYFRASLKDPAG